MPPRGRDERMKDLKPEDHGEAVAIYRQSVIGSLVNRELLRGELKAELEKLAKVSFRPPGSEVTTTHAKSTLERWYYALKGSELKGLRPAGRAKGHARDLPAVAK